MDVHAFTPFANPDLNPDCVKCGKPMTAAEHAAVIVVLPDEYAYLYNLLCSNPRVWNDRLRKLLALRVTSTEAHNAQVELTGRK